LTLFGYTFSIVLATAFYTYFWLKLTATKLPQLKGYEPLLAETLIIFTLIFGEILPKSLFMANAEFLTPLIVKVLYPLKKVLYPIVYTAKVIADFIAEKLKREPKYLSRKELVKILTSGRVELSKTRRLLVANILSFRDRRISEIVRPLYEVVMLPEDATVAQAAEKIKESGFSRLPVYATTLQNVVGYIQAYDLLKAKKEESIGRYIRPIRIVGEFERLKDVLDELIDKKEHIALVVDERGIVIGIVTLEDIVEEITGELYEENKHQEEEIKRIGPDRWIVNANLEISELQKLLQLDIPPGIYSTVGGFIQYHLGFIPKKGEVFTFGDYEFRIIEADERKIKKVLITPKGKN